MVWTVDTDFSESRLISRGRDQFLGVRLISRGRDRFLGVRLISRSRDWFLGVETDFSETRPISRSRDQFLGVETDFSESRSTFLNCWKFFLLLRLTFCHCRFRESQSRVDFVLVRIKDYESRSKINLHRYFYRDCQDFWD